MRGKPYYAGYTIGWDWARAYATGTKAARREIRRKLHRMAPSDNTLVQGIWQGFADLVEQLVPSIKSGQVARTINPWKLSTVLERV
jgi:hypothetical protein